MRQPTNLRVNQGTNYERLGWRRLFLVWLALCVSLDTGCSNNTWDGDAPHEGPRLSDKPGLPAYVTVAPDNTGDGWPTSTPDNEGMDAQALLSTLNDLKSGSYPGVDSLILIKNGNLIAEGYFNGYGRDTLHDVRSAAKSITSALAGIAIDQKAFSLQDTLGQFYNLDTYQNPDPRKAAIKVINLLNMNSGLNCDDWIPASPGQEENIYLSNDWIKFVLDLSMMNAPGAQQSHYCTGGAILIGNIVSMRTGMPLDFFADAYLFSPLKIQNVSWPRSPDGQATGGGGMWMRPRDAAKFGQLYSNQGLWQGRRLISSQWIDQSKQSMTTMTTGQDNAYGLFWWKRDFLVRGSTQQAFFAWGNGGNFILVFPQENLVVVFTASNYNSPLADQPFNILSQRVLPALR